MSTETQTYNDMLQYLKLKLQKPFTASKIIMLVASGIKFLSTVKGLTGSEKKDLVLHALSDTIKQSDYITETEKQELQAVIDTFGSTMIDNLVDFAQNAYTKIQKTKWYKSLKSNCSCCAPQEHHGVARSLDIEGYTDLKHFLGLKLQRPVTATKVIGLVAAGVKYIEKYTTLSGAEKKDLVIRALRDVILDSDLLSSDDKDLLTLVVDTYADQTIDYLVDFGRKAFLKVKSSCKC